MKRMIILLVETLAILLLVIGVIFSIVGIVSGQKAEAAAGAVLSDVVIKETKADSLNKICDKTKCGAVLSAELQTKITNQTLSWSDLNKMTELINANNADGLTIEGDITLDKLAESLP